jgi:hypothetical protein
VQLSVLDRHLTAPPGSPDEGDRYIVASGPLLLIDVTFGQNLAIAFVFTTVLIVRSYMLHRIFEAVQSLP